MSNLVVVTGRPFAVYCAGCNTRAYAGDVDTTDTKHHPVYADLDGEPFKAYYCATCAKVRKHAKTE